MKHFTRSDVREHNDGRGNITLVHIPSGVHVSATNSEVAWKLLQSRIGSWQQVEAKHNG